MTWLYITAQTPPTGFPPHCTEGTLADAQAALANGAPLTGVITGWNNASAIADLQHHHNTLAWVVWEPLSPAFDSPKTNLTPDDVWVGPLSIEEQEQRLQWAAQRGHERGHALSKLAQLQKQFKGIQDDTARRNHAVESDLYMARQLQQSLLPKPLADPVPAPDDLAFCFSKVPVITPHLMLRGLYIPSDALGGDLYDAITYPDGSVGLLVADVSGHGIKAGFITAILKALYQQTARQTPNPAAILQTLNHQLAGIINTGDYITAVAMHATPQPDGTLTLLYSSAGHPYPMKIFTTEQGVTLERLEAGSAPLVWFADMTYDNTALTLNAGDGVFIFTDGITELRNASDELFGEERLEERIKALYQRGANPLPDYLLQELSDFSEGVPLGDDVSLLWLTVGNSDS
ncbi:MAG: PP2C family protein-serine/threonine phosphatase [Vampirovibrionales bacterium]|nr:PP2C family protein-serine/threonine phosphatase [Vampirovibrionales bacterium]